MGVQTDIMHNFASQEIKRLFSSFESWNEITRSNKSNYDCVVTLERFVGGHKEIAKVGVTFNREVSPDLIKELAAIQNRSDGFPVVESFTVIVPSNTITSSVPADFRIHTMQSFSFDGEELVWVKKPVAKSSTMVSNNTVAQPV
jgi:hypothetical protein